MAKRPRQSADSRHSRNILLVAGIVLGCALLGVWLVSHLLGPAVRLPVRRSFNYTLYTHCGIQFAKIDGQVWETDYLGDRAGNPPPNWSNPEQAGQMSQLQDDLMVFTSGGHQPLYFHPSDKSIPICF